PVLGVLGGLVGRLDVLDDGLEVLDGLGRLEGLLVLLDRPLDVQGRTGRGLGPTPRGPSGGQVRGLEEQGRRREARLVPAGGRGGARGTELGEDVEPEGRGRAGVRPGGGLGGRGLGGGPAARAAGARRLGVGRRLGGGGGLRGGGGGLAGGLGLGRL